MVFDMYNKKKTVLVTEISERTGTPELLFYSFREVGDDRFC